MLLSYIRGDFVYCPFLLVLSRTFRGLLRPKNPSFVILSEAKNLFGAAFRRFFGLRPQNDKMSPEPWFRGRCLLFNQSVFPGKEPILVQEGPAPGLDTAEVGVEVEAGMGHLDDAAGDVGAVVGHPFQVRQQIGPDKAGLDGSFASLEPQNMPRPELLLEKIDHLLRREPTNDIVHPIRVFLG